MGFEDKFIGGLDRSGVVREKYFLRAKEKSVAILKSKKLDIERFRGVFSDEKISDDLDYVQERREQFSTEGIGGHAFEGFVHYAIENAEWFGDQASTLPVSEYDDFKNGVDLLVEYGGAGNTGFSHLAFGIDVTYQVENIEKKINSAVGHLRKGTLTTVEYFESPKMGIKGTLSDIPHLVVGLQKETVEELMKMFGKDDQLNLKRDISQFIVLEQMKLQLEGFLSLIPSLKLIPERQVLVMKRLTVGLERVKSILESKKDLYEELFVDAKDYQKVLKSDSVYQAIHSKMQDYLPHPPRRGIKR